MMSLKIDEEKYTKDGILLSFSGGGIRSASFNSGCLRELVEDDECKISHISTVSGGGYIGTSFIANCVAYEREINNNNGVRNISKKTMKAALIGDYDTKTKPKKTDGKYFEPLLSRMEKNSNYFLRQGALSGVLSILISMLTDCAIFFCIGLFLSEIMVAWHAKTIMKVINLGQWHLLSEPMVIVGIILLSFVVLILVISPLITCVVGTFFKPFCRNNRNGVSFHSPTACWIDTFETFPLLRKIWNSLFALIGLIGLALGFYWLMVTLTCIWGIFHNHLPSAESYTWFFTTVASIGGLVTVSLESNNIIDKIKMGVILLALAMSGPVFIIVSFTRLALWNVASQVCWDVDNFGPYCVLQDSKRPQLYEPFDMYNLEFFTVEMVALAVLGFWAAIFSKTSMALHEYYRIKLSSAFYHETTRDIQLKELPSSPRLIVNTTVNKHPSKDETIERKSHVFILSKDRCGSRETGYYVTRKVKEEKEKNNDIKTDVEMGSKGVSTNTFSDDEHEDEYEHDYEDEDSYLSEGEDIDENKTDVPISTQYFFDEMMLSTAMAVSGAAVANNFGTKTDMFPSIVRRIITMTISFFNFGWGIWVPRPDGGNFKNFLTKYSIRIHKTFISTFFRRLFIGLTTNSVRIVIFVILVSPGVVLSFLLNYLWRDRESIEVRYISIAWAAVLVLLPVLNQIKPITALLSFSPYGRHLQQILGTSALNMDYVYLSDGGHLENLGAYTLFKRQRSLLMNDESSIVECIVNYIKNDKATNSNEFIYNNNTIKDRDKITEIDKLIKTCLEEFECKSKQNGMKKMNIRKTVTDIVREKNKERHSIYSFDAGFDETGTLESLSTLLNLAKEDRIISDWSFEMDSVRSVLPFTSGEYKGKSDGRIIKLTIEYPKGQKGTMWYCKSLLTVNETDAMVLLSRQDNEFPYHSTANQFFNRNLFRAYHQLGRTSCLDLISFAKGKRILKDEINKSSMIQRNIQNLTSKLGVIADGIKTLSEEVNYIKEFAKKNGLSEEESLIKDSKKEIC